jgi:hypothetical protein
LASQLGKVGIIRNVFHMELNVMNVSFKLPRAMSSIVAVFIARSQDRDLCADSLPEMIRRQSTQLTRQIDWVPGDDRFLPPKNRDEESAMAPKGTVGITPVILSYSNSMVW